MKHTAPILVLVTLGLSACATAEPSLMPLGPDGQDTSVFLEEGGEDAALEATWAHVDASTRLSEGVELLLEDVEIDTRGMVHSRFQQELQGVPVWGGEAILHLQRNGTFFTLTDSLRRGLSVDTTPDYQAHEAVDVALFEYGSPNGLSEQPEADLWVMDDGAEGRLVWRVQVRDIEDAAVPSMPVFFIDAHSGEVVDWYDDLQTASLSDSDHVTYDNKNSTRYNKASVGDSSDAELLTTHDAVQSTLDFLAAAPYSRDSYDGSGAQVRSYGHYGRSYVNAFWDGSRLSFGDGDGYYSNYLGVLDVTAHEFGHALTDYEANLTYSYESGALNEAASDMLAAAVEASVDGTTTDAWDIGEDCWVEPGTTALRYMDAPSLDGASRDHYSDRYTGSSDGGGVHWNSGIANHWFYLLSEGGTHHDSAFATNTITALGIDVAYEIWYEALTNYMTSSTDYSAARTATESACTGLGYTTTECESVSYAWYEVGVGSDPAGGGGSTGGSSTGGSSTGGGTPTTSCTGTEVSWTGSLTGTGDQAVEPGGTYASYSAPSGALYGPSGTDYDLYLYKWHKKRGWTLADSSETSSSTEYVSSSSSGDFYFIAYSYSGSGAYELCIDG